VTDYFPHPALGGPEATAITHPACRAVRGVLSGQLATSWGTQHIPLRTLGRNNPTGGVPSLPFVRGGSAGLDQTFSCSGHRHERVRRTRPPRHLPSFPRLLDRDSWTTASNRQAMSRTLRSPPQLLSATTSIICPLCLPTRGRGFGGVGRGRCRACRRPPSEALVAVSEHDHRLTSPPQAATTFSAHSSHAELPILSPTRSVL